MNKKSKIPFEFNIENFLSLENHRFSNYSFSIKFMSENE